MSALTPTKVPALWRIKDPVKLMARGQLLLLGFPILDSKTDDQAWSELESAISQRIGHHARPGSER